MPAEQILFNIEKKVLNPVSDSYSTAIPFVTWIIKLEILVPLYELVLNCKTTFLEGCMQIQINLA